MHSLQHPLAIITLLFLMSASVLMAQPTTTSHPDISPGAENEQRLHMLSMTPKIMLKQVLFTGNTAIATEELTAVTAPYLNRELATEDLETLRQALIQLYIGNGYINSGVIIPDQKVGNGIITMTVIEGGLNKVEIEGLQYYNESFLSSKLNSAAARPLNVNKLQQSLQLLQQDPRIKRINAELVPGAKPGDAELKVKVGEASPWKVSTRFDNDASPSSGSYQGDLMLANQNLLGFGDTLSAHTAITEGATDYGGRYSVPVSLHDTTLDIYYYKSHSDLLEDKFDGLDIKSESDSLGVKIRQPFMYSSTDEFALSLAGEKRSSVSKMLGEKFSFSAGEDNGESKLSVLRFTQEWTHLTASSVAGLYSTFNFGLDALDATTNSDLPDGRFFSWIGQGMVLSKILSTNTHGMLRLTGQFTADQLLPLEKFPIGGMGSVRGYRVNTIVRDNGVNGSGEWRIPLFNNDNWLGTLQLVPFIDFGWGKNNDAPKSSPETITGVGGGLRWQLSNLVTAEAYYGYGLRKVHVDDEYLQDKGIHFQVTIDWL